MSTLVEQNNSNVGNGACDTYNLQVVFPEAQQVEIKKNPVPVPAAGEILIRNKASLISTGTELTIFSGEFPKGSIWAEYGQFPFTTGYSACGTVVGIGKGVDRNIIGTRVAHNGPHASYHTAPAGSVQFVPSGVADEEAAFRNLAAIVMNGVRRSKVNWGEGVVIYGLGLLGQLAAQFCALNGARPVIGVDVSSARLALLPDTPVFKGLHALEDDVPGMVKQLTRGRMADVVFEVTGNQNLIPGEFAALRNLGRFILLSSPKGATSFDFHDLCNSPSYEIVGAHVCSAPAVETPYNPWTHERNLELFFDHIINGDIDIPRLITKRVNGEDAPGVYHELFADRSKEMGVVLEW